MSTPDEVVGAAVEGLEPAAAAVALAALVNRAAARLHALARAQAGAHKDQPEWPAWAQLQNASRSLVLQASTCRDLAAKLPAAEGTGPSGTPGAPGPSGATSTPGTTDPSGPTGTSGAAGPSGATGPPGTPAA